MNKLFRYLKIITIFFTLILFCFTGCGKKEEINVKDLGGKKELKLDVNRSTINITAEKKNGKHTGTVNFLNGTLSLESGFPVSGNFVVDMNSLKITDVKDSVENNRILSYLKSKDFLDVEKYPYASVNIKSVLTLKTNAKPDVNSTIKGSVTIKDSTLMIGVLAYTNYYLDSIISKAKLSLNSEAYNIPLKSINVEKDYKNNPFKENFDLEVYLVAK